MARWRASDGRSRFDSSGFRMMHPFRFLSVILVVALGCKPPVAPALECQETATPDASKITIQMQPPGTDDVVFGSAGAVVSRAMVDVYLDRNLQAAAASAQAAADGSFTVAISDNAGTIIDVTAKNAECPPSGVVSFGNDITGPSDPQFKLRDKTSQSLTHTNERAVDVHIDTVDNDVEWWLVTEESGVPGPSHEGWQTKRPSQIQLSEGQGTRTIYLWNRDRAGNPNTTAGSASITLDNALPSPPSVELFDLSTGATALTNDIAIGVALYHQEHVAWFLTSDPLFVPTELAAWEATPPEEFLLRSIVSPATVYAWAKDEAGNVSATADQDSIDLRTLLTAASSLIVRDPSSGSTVLTDEPYVQVEWQGATTPFFMLTQTTTGRPLEAGLSESANPAGVLIQSWVPWNGIFPVREELLSHNTLVTIYLWLKDEAGNVTSNPTVRSIRHRTVVLQPTFVVNNGHTLTATASVPWAITDLDEYVHAWLVCEACETEPSGDFQGLPLPANPTHTLAGPGTATLTLYLRDVAGNQSAGLSRTIIFEAGVAPRTPTVRLRDRDTPSTTTTAGDILVTVSALPEHPNYAAAYSITELKVDDVSQCDALVTRPAWMPLQQPVADPLVVDFTLAADGAPGRCVFIWLQDGAGRATERSAAAFIIVNICGDGNVLAGEECDDGEGNADTAACTRDCTQARCGDRLPWALVEQCDLGDGQNVDSGLCTASCRLNVCGDGARYDGHEACDDYNAQNDDGCLSANGSAADRCVLASCGDGFVCRCVASPCDCPGGMAEECDAGPVGAVGVCTAACGLPPPPNPPVLVGVLLARDQVELSWTAVAGEAYTLYWSHGVEPEQQRTATTPMLLGNLNEATYRYQLVASHAGGTSARSNVVEITTGFRLSAELSSSQPGRFRLTWTSTDATPLAGYRLLWEGYQPDAPSDVARLWRDDAYVGAYNDDAGDNDLRPFSGREYLFDPTIKGREQYWLTLIAVNDTELWNCGDVYAGDSVCADTSSNYWSDEEVAVLVDEIDRSNVVHIVGIPRAPSLAVWPGFDQNTIQVGLRSVTTHYTVYWSHVSGFDETSDEGALTSGEAYTDPWGRSWWRFRHTGLTSPDTLYYRATASNATGESVWSVEAMATTIASPCEDRERNGTETDVDCGGACSRKCHDNLGCAFDADCRTGACVDDGAGALVCRTLPLLLSTQVGSSNGPDVHLLGDVDNSLDAPGTSEIGVFTSYDTLGVYSLSGATLTAIRVLSGGPLATNAGDWNTDGHADTLVAYYAFNNDNVVGYGEGRVEVRSGFNGLSLFWSIGTVANENLGLAIASGLINGDAVPDILVAFAKPARAVSAYAGGSGALIRTFSDDVGGAQSRYAKQIAVIGDVDGDSWGDVTIANPSYSVGLDYRGRVYVYSGQTGVLLRDWQGAAAQEQLGTTLSALEAGRFAVTTVDGRVVVYSGASADPIFSFGAPDTAEVTGSATVVRAGGDINGDGVGGDIVVGAPQAQNRNRYTTGKVYLLTASGAVIAVLESPLPHAFGNSIDAGRDVNGDSRPDLLIGSEAGGNLVQIYGGLP